MIRSRFVGMLAVVASASWLSACSGAAGDSPEQAAEGKQAILGGSPAVGEKYAAVGALVEGLEYPGYGVIPFNAFCSATLVGPRAIVTARHCTPFIDAPTYPELSVYFAIGDNAYFAEQYIPVTSYEAAPPSRKKNGGLLLDGGRDVAVAQLASEPEGVVPAKLGRFQKHMLGRKFEIAGFGINDDLDDGARYAGTVKARQMHGLWYPALFHHNRWAYWNWYWTDAVTDPTWQEGRQWWRTYRLEAGYELLAGGRKGEALGCFGDSGGPLMRGDSAHTLTVYGVGFASEASQSKVCDLGSAYLVFHKKDIWSFLQRALH